MNVHCSLRDSSELQRFLNDKNVQSNQLIVVYCAVGVRSGKHIVCIILYHGLSSKLKYIGWLVRSLRKKGFLNVKVLAGGFYHWVNSGRPIFQQQEKPTDKVKPQHLMASTLLSKEVLAKKKE